VQPGAGKTGASRLKSGLGSQVDVRRQQRYVPGDKLFYIKHLSRLLKVNSI
jgi:hypothetical protein